MPELKVQISELQRQKHECEVLVEEQRKELEGEFNSGSWLFELNLLLWLVILFTFLLLYYSRKSR